MKQINATALHAAVIEQAARAARHPTRMTRLVSEAIAQMPIQENRKPEVSALTKKLTDVASRMSRVQEAIETGTGSVAPLVTRLAPLQVERPDVAEVCRHLSRLLEIYAAAEDNDRTTILQGLVSTIKMQSKTKGTCEVRLYSEVPSTIINSNTPQGEILDSNCLIDAGGGVIANNSVAYAPIVTEQPTLKLTLQQRRALYTT